MPIELNYQPEGPNEMTPKNAQKILQDLGMIVTLDQATTILEFLNKLADISTAVYLDNRTNISGVHRTDKTSC